jgi:dihydrofolate reductase
VTPSARPPPAQVYTWRMRKLIVQQWVTVDNVAAEEDGRLTFVSVQPFAVSNDDDFKASAMAFIDGVDTMVLGAKTYAMARDYWPTADDQGAYGERLNRLAKVVASTRLRDAPWGTFPAATVTSDGVATVRELKRREGRDIWVWGSLSLMRSLFAADVVDEVQLRVCPTTRGSGTRVFEDRRDLRALEARTFDNGVVLLRYEARR